MIALAQASPDDHLHVVDLPYRLSSWGLDDPGNAALWVDPSGNLVAWAVLQTPFWTIDYAIHPETEQSLHQPILDWAGRRATEVAGTPAGVPAWHAMVFADQTGRMRDLAAAGFVDQADAGEDAWSKVLLRRPATAPATATDPPAGFVVRPLAGESEVEAYVDVHQAVFQSKNMTAAWRARTLRHPAYRPELDMIAIAPDGQPAGFCVGWLGRRGVATAGQIEPFGVRREYRSLGLAWALLSATLSRLLQAGAEAIYVETDNYRNAAFGVYKAAGFAVFREVLVFGKDFPATI